jgi:4-azaleucine resistance transporter AzlC
MSDINSPVSLPKRSYFADFRHGFVATMVLWPGDLPYGIAFAILARAGGFTPLETQALSLLVYAGASQVAIITLAATGAAALPIVLTVLVLNLRHVLYGLSISRWFRGRTRPPRGILAYILTDETYGLTTKAYLDGQGSDAFYFGSGISLFSSFNLATLAGILLGTLLPDPNRIGLSFIFPLTFLALLLPLLRNWRHILVAVIAGVSAIILSHFVAGGVTVLVAGVAAAAIGAFLDRGKSDGATDEAGAVDLVEREPEVSL